MIKSNKTIDEYEDYQDIFEEAKEAKFVFNLGSGEFGRIKSITLFELEFLPVKNKVYRENKYSIGDDYFICFQDLNRWQELALQFCKK